MYVFPGDDLSIKVDFEVGGEPVTPSIATYQVRDKNSVVAPSSPVNIASGGDVTYLTIKGDVNSLPSGAMFNQLRADVIFSADNAVFKESHVYYVVPDLFLGFDDTVARQVIGVPNSFELEDDPDYYRAYIDLVTSPIGDAFYSALMGSNISNATAARNLILYKACLMLLPSFQLTIFKTEKSETSEYDRFNVDLSSIQSNLQLKYALYYAQIQSLTETIPTTTLIVLDTPVDAITGS